MGFAPWKLNNTGNQIGWLGHQCRLGQWIPDVIRQFPNKHLNEQCKLFFGWLEDSTYAVYHGCYDDLEGFAKRDICQLISEKEEGFSQGAVIVTSSLFHRDHEISGKYDCYMSSQSIIGQTMAFRHQLKIGFAGLEKDLNLPYADFLEMPILGVLRCRIYYTSYIYRHFLL